MKYLFIIFIFSIKLNSATFPNTPTPDYLGIILGINFSTISHNINNLSSKHNADLNLGVQYKMNLGNEFFFSNKYETYSNYSYMSVIFRFIGNQKSIDYKYLNSNGNNVKFSENNLYFQLSAYYSLKLFVNNKNNLHILLGPNINYLYKVKGKKNISVIDTEQYNTFEVAFTLGLGYELKYENFILGLEYNYMHSFTDKYNYQNDYIKNNSHLINFIFSPRIRF